MMIDSTLPELLPLPLSLRLLRRLPLPHKLGMLERIYGRRLAEDGVRWVECAHGVPWKLDLADPTQRWCVFGDYEGSVQMDWIRSRLAGGGVVVDSGASIGQMVMYFGPMKGVTVHAFEPTRASRDWLSDCVGRNGFTTVEVMPYGLSDRSGERPILSRGSRSTMRIDSDPYGSIPRESIVTIRLDEYCRDCSIERIRLWKLDVEHHETAALAGAARLLDSQAIDAILIEVSHVTFDSVKDRLQRAGYRLWWLVRSGLSAVASLPRPGTYNLAAIPDRVAGQ